MDTLSLYNLDTPPRTKPDSMSSERCVSYSTAHAYDVKGIARSLQSESSVSFFRDVIFVNLLKDAHDTIKGYFCFPYGALVMWGIKEDEEASILEKLKPFELERTETIEKEIMGFSIGARKTAIIDDQIVLASPHISLCLALSHGMAQSVKLSFFESVVKKSIDTTKYIPEHLSRRGTVPLSKREIGKKMGELFLERSSINLHLELLDQPEYFWDHPELEPIYSMIANHLELEGRLDVINKRLDIIHDLLEMLGNELNHQHSSKLEWIIIILIVMEVVISLFREFSPH